MRLQYPIGCAVRTGAVERLWTARWRATYM